MATVEEELLFRVDAVFMIRGRGLVATGVVERGEVRSGDQVVVRHGDDEFMAYCRGVELIHVKKGFGIDPDTIGLLLTDLTIEQIAEGDVVRGTIAPNVP
jgi:translation elongation factor EF-Tu-like GTPase